MIVEKLLPQFVNDKSSYKIFRAHGDTLISLAFDGSDSMGSGASSYVKQIYSIYSSTPWFLKSVYFTYSMPSMELGEYYNVNLLARFYDLNRGQGTITANNVLLHNFIRCDSYPGTVDIGTFYPNQNYEKVLPFNLRMDVNDAISVEGSCTWSINSGVPYHATRYLFVIDEKVPDDYYQSKDGFV